jgi:xanthosine utilization system XapX-like protein
MKLLYLPFKLINGLIAARLGKKVFDGIWSQLDRSPPPNPSAGDASTGKVVGARALEAGVMAAVAAAVDRFGAQLFHHLVGAWPGKPAKEEQEEKERKQRK